MAIGNIEVMHECTPEHLRMGKASLKWGKETKEEGKHKRVILERSTAGKKKKVPTA